MRAFFLCSAIAVAVVSGIARASDGRLEINQACAAMGCFAGDAAGFPITIVAQGSYVLTSDLVVPAASYGIDLLTPGVTLDLNGFTVRGPVTCSRPSETFYDARTITCSASGVATGIRTTDSALVRNGRVVGFEGYGVLALGRIASHTNVEDVRVEENALGGIRLTNGTARRINATSNGGDGILNDGSGDESSAAVIEDSNISFNKGAGIGMAAKIRNCRITYNGDGGVIHRQGDQNSSISDSEIYRNIGKAIDAHGSYRDNEIYLNDNVGGQVVGTMSDEGGNNVH